MKTSIVYLISNLRKTGPVIQLYNIVRHLNRENFEPFIITLSREGEKSFMMEFKHLGIPIITLNLPQGSLKGWEKIYEILRKINPRIVHSHGLRADFINSKIRGNYIKISTVHSNPLEDYPKQYGVRGYLAAILHIKILRKIPFRISCSKSLSLTLQYKFKLSTIPILNSTTEFDRDQNKAVIEKKTIIVPDGVFLFAFAGPIVKVKNVQFLIKVFNKLYHSRRDIFLIVLGEGRYLEPLKRIAKENVLFLGYVDDPKMYFDMSNAYVSASISEGLPTAVLEAGSCGLPLFLSNIPSHKEIINTLENHGVKAGKLFELNVNKCAEEIIEFAEQVRMNIFDKIAIQKAFKEFFGSKRMSSEYENIYLRILGGKDSNEDNFV